MTGGQTRCSTNGPLWRSEWYQEALSDKSQSYFLSEYSAYLCWVERAEERTRTAYPCSLRVITQALQVFAGGCKYRIDKPFSLLWLAPCCTVLRSRWYQSGINRGIAPSQSCSLAHASEVRSAPGRHTNIKLTLDHYSHWMPSMSRDTAEGINEALG
jgi:hypothetical protein